MFVSRHNSLMTKRQLCVWFALGVWHALAVFFSFYFMWPSYWQIGDDLNCFGALVACTCVLVVNLKMLLESRFWSWPHVLIILASILSYVGVTLLYDQFLLNNWLINNSAQFRTYHRVVYPLPTWLVTLVACAIALIPDLFIHYWRSEKFISFRPWKTMPHSLAA